MARYEYAPIQHLQHAFRLLLLRAGTLVDYDIECELIDALTDDEDLLPYEALSYTWGSDVPLKAIQVGGRTMFVRTNLRVALEHLRLPDQDRLLWVDAICINQENDTEKAHQVQQMANIYRRAEHVVVWLGTLEHESSLLMDSLSLLANQFRGTKHTASNQHKWQAVWKDIQGDDEDYVHVLQQGLKAILTHPWFRRGWIIQEIANARRATIYCSSHSIPCKIFALAPKLLHFMVASHCNSILELMAGPKDRPAWWSGGRDLYTLLHKFSNAKTTISRDAVFALLGICEDQSTSGSNHHKLVADYVASENMVIERALVAIYGCSAELVKDKHIATSVEELAKNVQRIDAEILHRLLISSETECLIELLQRTEIDLQLTSSARKAIEIQHGPDVLHLLSRHRNSATISDDFSILDIRIRQHEPSMPPAIANRVEGTESNTEARHQTLAFTLRQDTPQFTWRSQFMGIETQYKLLRAAASDKKSARELVKLLLPDLSNKVTIGEDVLCAAAANEERGASTVDVLLANASARYEITGKVLDTASKNTTSGHLILRRFLMSGRLPTQNNMSYDVGTMFMAAIDPVAGPKMVTLLLRHEQTRTADQSGVAYPDMAMAAFRAAVHNEKLCVQVMKAVDNTLDRVPLQGPLLEDLYANLHCRREIFEVLVSAFKDRSAKLDYLIAAAKLSGDEEFKKILLNHHAVGQCALSAGISLLEATTLGFSSLTASLFADRQETKRFIDLQDSMGRTALSYAAAQGSMSQVKRLLDAGASVDRPDNMGRTPLCWAALMNQIAVAGLLIDAGAQLLSAYCTCSCGHLYDLRLHRCLNWDCDFKCEVSPFEASPYKAVKVMMSAPKG